MSTAELDRAVAQARPQFVVADAEPAGERQGRSLFASLLDAYRARRERQAQARAAADVDTASAAQAKAPLTEKERRWQRRRRRIIFEEVLGWILVPIILIGGYKLVEGGLALMGIDMAALAEGFDLLMQAAKAFL